MKSLNFCPSVVLITVVALLWIVAPVRADELAPVLVLRGLYKTLSPDSLSYDSADLVTPKDGRYEVETGQRYTLIADVISRSDALKKLVRKSSWTGLSFTGIPESDHTVREFNLPPSCCSFVYALWFYDRVYNAQTQFEIWVVDNSGRESNHISLGPVVTIRAK